MKLLDTDTTYGVGFTVTWTYKQSHLFLLFSKMSNVHYTPGVALMGGPVAHNNKENKLSVDINKRSAQKHADVSAGKQPKRQFGVSLPTNSNIVPRT